MLAYSFCYRLIYALLSFLQGAYRHSLTCRLASRFAAAFKGWLQGSAFFRVFWVQDSLTLWHGSKTFACIAGVSARIKALLLLLSRLLARGRPGSRVVGLLQHYQTHLQASPVKVLMDVFLVFLAANLLIRLVLQAYSARSLLFFSALLVLTFLLRFYRLELEAALDESRILGLVRWFLALPGPGGER